MMLKQCFCSFTVPVPPPLCLREEFVPSATLRGRFAASVVATEGSVESLPLASLVLTGCFARDLVQGRMSEAESFGET